MTQNPDTPSLDIIVKTIEQYGCKLIDIDLENHILNIEGPEEAQTQCALALDRLLN
jgi:chitinase